MPEYKIEYKLENFEGPLDLLLHLIEKHKIDIFDIPIASILEQYLDYIYIMERLDLYVASEFIDMVAKLLYIKSRLLLPKEENEPDPREELVKILLDYSEIKEIAAYLSSQFDTYKNRYEKPEDKLLYEPEEEKPEQIQTISPAVLFEILMEIAAKKGRDLPPTIESIKILTNKKAVTIAEKIISIVRRLYKCESLGFLELLKSGEEGRGDIVATFAAILELLRTNRIDISGSDILNCQFTLNKSSQKQVNAGVGASDE
ncbi:MAG: segregation/condensation protein A [Oscillospiraceae bacterium]|nr:segregation/condensation protein A [Oscillospiraceae bacterium]